MSNEDEGVDTAPRAVVRTQDDPFMLMDRMDDDAIRKELEGIASDELVYVVKGERGKDVTGLSKAGVDECCNVLAHSGEVIRETGMEWSRSGEAEDAEAFFIAHAARFAVSKDGTEIKLDEVIGTKRVPLWYEPSQEMHVDQVMPFGKHKKEGHTWRQVAETDSSYLTWMADSSDNESARTFASAVLAWHEGDAEEPRLLPGRRLNPFWFEHGTAKALRNARFRLIPAETRAVVIASAKTAGKVREIDKRGGSPEAQEESITDAQRELLAKFMKSSLMQDSEREEFALWLGGTPDPTKNQASATIDSWTVILKKRRAERKAKKDANGGDADPTPPPSTTQSEDRTSPPVPTTPDTTTGDDGKPLTLGEQKFVIIAQIEELFRRADKTSVGAWRGVFDALVKDMTVSTVEDFERIKSTLEKTANG